MAAAQHQHSLLWPSTPLMMTTGSRDTLLHIMDMVHDMHQHCRAEMPLQAPKCPAPQPIQSACEALSLQPVLWQVCFGQ